MSTYRLTVTAGLKWTSYIWGRKKIQTSPWIMTISEVSFCDNKQGRLCAAYRIPGCNAHPDEKNASPFANPCLSFFISGLIAVGSLWDSEAVGESHADHISVNERKRQVCLTLVGANWAHVGRLRMRKSGPKCSSSFSWGSMWPQVNLSPQWAPVRLSAAVFTTTWVMDQRPGKNVVQMKITLQKIYH